MSNTSLCVTVLLLPPEGHINILPVPRQPHSPPQVTVIHIQRHDYTNVNRIFHKLTECLCCLPPGSIRSQDQACPHMEAFGPTPSLISPLPPWLNQAGHYCGGGREGGRVTREGERNYYQTLWKAATHCSRQVTQAYLLLSLSIFSSLAPNLSFVSSKHSIRLKKELMYILYDAENQKSNLQRKGMAQSLKRT